MELSLREFVTAVGGKVVGALAEPDAPLNAVVKDSRDAVPGCLFAAILGERSDGHDFIAAAAQRDAVCALGQRAPEDCPIPVIIVPDTVEALGAAAEFYRGKFDIPIIGVTGSVGKTTAKELLWHVLSQRFKVHKTFANLNNNLGTPLTLFGLTREHEAAVIELGISHFGEMTQLARMVRPTIAYFSAIGYAHLEFLENLDGVLRAKTELLPYLPENGVIFLNGDDAQLCKIKVSRETVRFGLSKDCSVRAENVKLLGAEGMSLTIVGGSRRFEARLGAFGLHLVSAALGAAAVGIYLGLTDEEIARGLAEYSPVGGRSALESSGELTIINDCYNANPNSVASALDSLTLLDGRRVAILGDMFELGDDERALHREVGAKAANSGVQLLLTTGGLSRETHAGALSAGLQNAKHFETRAELISALPRLIKSGDSVLVKASHSARFEEIVEALRGL
ncbi:MAG: UDP-N-acetylmuramoyl-tripeptide--D-alanyl-D-alanine ligase [Oscillospiraceae bacterium]|jgi:UDP-N-acetylmuramoyl-tripeptide--D-alanyl-D-alanine ligase|nr:UDP-N-acetylmuramoyl-tripeptide--D-alanyl-D-alanine ligase [Oscillospiraceae bacterium]